ncbi:hypothetical protein FE257_004704 [Aspergillus nanangensis]|uniref:Zn(2)-C6 fungal-type domain-containing protein n=1 Tax=Aspergillus nanangensis TaxID=2582783 RepID=A0AAD4GZT0_ASPNN|nr:hypothetical protein FE257_004704 [Aspergillus nanangensis]
MQRPSRSRAIVNHDYQRAFKACIPCHRRKVKCQTKAEGHPCARCAKKRLDCQFTAKRPWAREKRDSFGPGSSQVENNLPLGSSSASDREEVPYICYPATEDRSTKGLHKMVSSSNDALDILFRTAVQGSNTRAEDQRPFSPAAPAAEAIRIWSACRFVKMGWFTAREAITLVDLFFKNMVPYTPIITGFYLTHQNHYWLITQEPTLCCVILLISSRYHVLPSAGGKSRGHSIHHRLWQHCQHLILRIILGQEKLSKAKTRHIGSIEALLLLAEWYPRALHFPPENDGWDSALIMTELDGRDPPSLADETVTLKDRWKEDVIEPTRRNDRMAWMVVSSAVALAHELGVFQARSRTADQSRPAPTPEPERDARAYLEELEYRRRRLPPLLYVFVNSLASRMGCSSLMADDLDVGVWERLLDSPENREWVGFMASLVELTRLTRGVTEAYFPLTSNSDENRRRDIESLKEWKVRLTRWQDKRPTFHERPLNDILNIEHHYLIVFLNSISMQSFVEQSLTHPDSERISPSRVESIDHVISSSCAILNWIIQHEDHSPRCLQYLPISIFHRVISASIFLLKALVLGVRATQVQECLDLLDQVSDTLQASVLDDVHLVTRYAVLLKMHVERVRRTFTSALASAPDAEGAAEEAGDEVDNAENIARDVDMAMDMEMQASLHTDVPHQPLPRWSDGLGAGADDWFSFPIDPLMAPFGGWDGIADEEWGLDSSYLDLDFIWNLPP